MCLLLDFPYEDNFQISNIFLYLVCPEENKYKFLYLQNQLLNGSKTYETNYVIIGSDVTNKVPQGSVVINSGNTIVRAHQVATITKDFEVKAGAEFMITIE